MFADFFAQVNRSLDAGTRAKDTFKSLMRLLSSHLNHGDDGASFGMLHMFGLSNGTPLSEYHREFRNDAHISDQSPAKFMVLPRPFTAGPWVFMATLWHNDLTWGLPWHWHDDAAPAVR